jgi:hypothetical protein
MGGRGSDVTFEVVAQFSYEWPWFFFFSSHALKVFHYEIYA